MLKGLIKYHFILLIKDPTLIIFGLAFPFVQLFLMRGSGDDAYLNLFDLGMVLFMLIAVVALCWGAGYNHVHSREIKFLRRLRMSPLKPAHYLVSGILLNVGILLIFTAVLVIVAVAIFDIDAASKNWPLIITSLLLAFTMFYVMGMFTANALKKAKNSQSLLYTVFISMIVIVNLFAMENLPNFVHVIIRNTPITYAANTLHSAWMGTNLFYGHDFIAMVACTIVFGLLSVKVFKYE